MKATPLITWTDALAAGRVTPEQALALFDSLPPVAPEALLGAWRGASFPTGHPLDGALEVYHWWGKRFESAEHVHPLVFSSRSGKQLSLRPLAMLLLLRWLDRGPVPRWPVLAAVLRWLMPMIATRGSRARLRRIEHRGQMTAAMVYDHLPIQDVFRYVDPDTVLGLMDLKGATRSFFFVLRRADPRG